MAGLLSDKNWDKNTVAPRDSGSDPSVSGGGEWAHKSIWIPFIIISSCVANRLSSYVVQFLQSGRLI